MFLNMLFALPRCLFFSFPTILRFAFIIITFSVYTRYFCNIFIARQASNLKLLAHLPVNKFFYEPHFQSTYTHERTLIPATESIAIYANEVFGILLSHLLFLCARILFVCLCFFFAHYSFA